MAGGAVATHGASTAGGAAHPLHLLLQNCSCCKGPLVGFPHEGHHLIIHISVSSSKLLTHAVVHGSKCSMRIRPRGIGWQLHPFPCWLCGWATYAGDAPLLNPGPPYGGAPLLPLHISLFLVAYGVDKYPGTGPQCPGT